jgi:hypothetical protein
MCLVLIIHMHCYQMGVWIYRVMDVLWFESRPVPRVLTCVPQSNSCGQDSRQLVAFCHRLGLTSCYNSLYSTFVLCAFLHIMVDQLRCCVGVWGWGWGWGAVTGVC